MEKHQNIVHLCLGSKRSSVTNKRPCLSTQGAVASELICYKVTHCSKVVTFFSFLADLLMDWSNLYTHLILSRDMKKSANRIERHNSFQSMKRSVWCQNITCQYCTFKFRDKPALVKHQENHICKDQSCSPFGHQKEPFQLGFTCAAYPFQSKE